MNGRCAWRGCGKVLTGRQRRFCSPQCENKHYVARRRRELKRLAVAHKGGKCLLCGYNRCLEALTFHHRNGHKDFGIAAKGYTRRWEAVRAELDQCILVCANCHTEIHAGLLELAALASNDQRKNGVNSGNPQHFGWRQS